MMGINVFYIILGASQMEQLFLSSSPLNPALVPIGNSASLHSTDVYKDLMRTMYCSRHWRYSSERD